MYLPTYLVQRFKINRSEILKENNPIDCSTDVLFYHLYLLSDPSTSKISRGNSYLPPIHIPRVVCLRPIFRLRI